MPPSLITPPSILSTPLFNILTLSPFGHIFLHLFPLLYICHSHSISLIWSLPPQIACPPFLRSLLYPLPPHLCIPHFLIYLNSSYNYCPNLNLILICFIRPLPMSPFLHCLLLYFFKHFFPVLPPSMSRLQFLLPPTPLSACLPSVPSLSPSHLLLIAPVHCAVVSAYSFICLSNPCRCMCVCLCSDNEGAGWFKLAIWPNQPSLIKKTSIYTHTWCCSEPWPLWHTIYPVDAFLNTWFPPDLITVQFNRRI